MCRGHFQINGSHVESGLLDAVAYAAREGVLIKSVLIDKDSFKLLKQYKSLQNTPHSFEINTSLGMITIHSD
jgi:hypothetical protein